MEGVTSANLCNKRSLVLEAGALIPGCSVHWNGCDHLLPCLVQTCFFTCKRHLLNHKICTMGTEKLTSWVPPTSCGNSHPHLPWEGSPASTTAVWPKPQLPLPYFVFTFFKNWNIVDFGFPDNFTHGHHQMVNTEIRLIIFFAEEDGEALYSQQKQGLELTVAQIISSLQQNSGLK